MGLFHFLIVVQAIIAAGLVGVILMQRSEGGGLGGGGSPSGLMSACGASDFLFVVLSITLAFVAARQGGPASINETLEKTAPAAKTEVAPVIAPPSDKAGTPAENSSEVPLDK
jgi:preprotein translocase subunit SecG